MLRKLLFITLIFSAFASYQGRAATNDIRYPESDKTMDYLERVANWQLPRLLKADYVTTGRKASENPKHWIQGAFYTGLAKLAERSDNPSYEKWIGMIGHEEKWRLAGRLFHADDHIIGQSYIWYYQRNNGTPQMLSHTISQFDKILQAKPNVSLDFIPVAQNKSKSDCQQRWCWADALFMSPPTWFALANATGNKKYADFAHKEFRATLDFLFDPETQLVYRDSRYMNMRGDFGEKIFWSRGIGWVMGGLVHTLDLLEYDDPNRLYYEQYFRRIAHAIKALQKEDGTWSSSLLAKDKMTNQESSGTAFFTYAFAWGIKQGLLNPSEYWPVTEKAWTALVSFIHPDGMLGYVQKIGDAPSESPYDSTQIYGSGAFLLAGTMIYDLGLYQEKRLIQQSEN
ncbi:glycoside hydrolase family 105 protein [Pseudomonadota bacterium]